MTLLYELELGEAIGNSLGISEAARQAGGDCNQLFVCLMRQAGERDRIRKFVREVKKERNQLFLKESFVVRKIDEVLMNKTEKVNNSVLKWRDELKELVEEETRLKIELKLDKNGSNCWGFHHRPLKKQLLLYYQIRDKVKELNATCKFEPFSIPIPGIEYFSIEKMKGFKSTIAASNQLLEALEDDKTIKIGLYGTRGTGKTLLVKAMSRKVLFLEIFDEVIFVNVSQNPNVKAIQEEIGECLGLRLEENSEGARGSRLSSRLESMDRVLVILDGVHEKLELDKIGIPCYSKRCKVLLTTRNQQVCIVMDCQKQIPLLQLSEDEAWEWFKDYSGLPNESSFNSFNKLAEEVFEKCKRLPRTIKEVASSLNGKPIEEWRGVFEALKHSEAEHQIFLSFRGDDTRFSFTSNLYRALREQGFKTFMDEVGLQGGDQISYALIQAIEKSRLSIIVFSENYAYSTWCFDELVKILECMRIKKQLVWPIFYKVDPSDVRHQTNKYEEAMEVHKKRFGNESEKVQKWRSALTEVANLSGEHFPTGYEYQFIQRIVEKANNNRHRLYI